VTSIWPDIPAAKGQSPKVRELLDYLAWVAEAAEQLGMHSGPDLESWRQRVQRAYSALVDPMMQGHGDPLPPDVPPSVRPGTWPDVPAAGIQGMTVRHQLTVIRTISEQSRRQGPAYHSPADAERWVARVVAAHGAMDHGAALTMPDSARTKAPPPPPTPPGASRTKGAKARPARGGTKRPAAKARSKPARSGGGAKRSRRK
jgi:hypothetical protein